MPARESGPLGLPTTIRACLFDLDGVLTDTASVHTRAWTATFDAFLRDRAEASGEPFTPFDPHADYLAHVDGRPRQDGVREFLRSRGVELTEGDPDDDPDLETVWGVGNRKNEEFQRTLREDGVLVFDGSRRYLAAVHEAGLAVAVVSSSANTKDVLEVTGLDRYVGCRVDGVTLREEGIAGKPAPDSFLRAAEILGVEATAAVVFEDALSGVQAGRAGGFGWVVGVDRAGQAEALRENGADVVVQDLEELL